MMRVRYVSGWTGCSALRGWCHLFRERKKEAKGANAADLSTAVWIRTGDVWLCPEMQHAPQQLRWHSSSKVPL
jgi:hypothetical protein